MKRATFLAELEKLDANTVFYVDECGVDEYLYRQYGYAPKGEKIPFKISGKRFKRTNIVAAKCGKKIVAPMIYDGTTDSILFETWFEKCLLKEIPAGSTVVMDNATFHRKGRLQEIADKHGVFLLFLPPYSPDLNPIEKFWAWLKNHLRDILHNFENLYDALLDCF